VEDSGSPNESQDLQTEENSKFREKLLAYKMENTRLLQQRETRMAERLCTAVGARCFKDK